MMIIGKPLLQLRKLKREKGKKEKKKFNKRSKFQEIKSTRTDDFG